MRFEMLDKYGELDLYRSGYIYPLCGCGPALGETATKKFDLRPAPARTC